jgi:hypothetical protein
MQPVLDAVRSSLTIARTVVLLKQVQVDLGDACPSEVE